MKYYEEFKKDHPETIGEKDSCFDLLNYSEWLEKEFEKQKSKLVATEWKDKVFIVKVEGSKNEFRYIPEPKYLELKCENEALKDCLRKLTKSGLKEKIEARIKAKELLNQTKETR